MITSGFMGIFQGLWHGLLGFSTKTSDFKWLCTAPPKLSPMNYISIVFNLLLCPTALKFFVSPTKSFSGSKKMLDHWTDRRHNGNNAHVGRQTNIY